MKGLQNPEKNPNRIQHCAIVHFKDRACLYVKYFSFHQKLICTLVYSMANVLFKQNSIRSLKTQNNLNTSHHLNCTAHKARSDPASGEGAKDEIQKAGNKQISEKRATIIGQFE